MMVARLEAQCIVFVAEGLLLTHESNPTAESGLKIVEIAMSDQNSFDTARYKTPFSFSLLMTEK